MRCSFVHATWHADFASEQRANARKHPKACSRTDDEYMERVHHTSNCHGQTSVGFLAVCESQTHWSTKFSASLLLLSS